VGSLLSPIAIAIWLTLAIVIGVGLAWYARKQRKADQAWNAMLSNQQDDRFE
jgi:hypothetical protein